MEVSMCSLRCLPRLITRCLLLLAVGSCFPATVLAQSTAEIRGTVQDETNAVIPGVVVTAFNELTGLERTAVSDSGGRYNFPRLPVGSSGWTSKTFGRSTS
jgi:hypothetical protein